MLHHNMLLVLGLLFAMCLLFMLSQKIRVSYPIFLVIGGLLIGFIPGMPVISIDPEIIFLIFLPPILYEAAWFTSWHEFWKWKRAIGFLAFGMVFITSICVAFASSALIPGFTLALGFLLGGIISPPDAVAATSVLKGLKVPKRFTAILEGESLVNDASSLIVFRFALVAVMTGHFVLQEAVVSFFVAAIMGVAVGISIGAAIYLLQRFLPTTPSLDTVMTLITPYVMYLAAEQFHFSGVLAVVSGGLFLSFRSHDFLNYESRIQSTGVWSSLIFVLNGLVFILIGLQLPVIVQELGDYSLSQAIYYGIIVSLLTILIRMALVFPSAYLPHLFSKRVRENEVRPSVKLVFLTGWAGMRGVVSLASALSIPLTLTSGEVFPERNLILFITFIVILITLVIQGLSMPILIRLLGVEEIDEAMPHEQQQSEIRLRMAKLALEHLDSAHAADVSSIAKLNRYHEQLLNVIGREERINSDTGEVEDRKKARQRFNKIFLELVDLRRKELLNLRQERIFDEEVLREYQHTLDLEEARMRL